MKSCYPTNLPSMFYPMVMWNQAAFLTSAAKFEQLPPDEGAEVAFIGRSNAGKSSAINTLVGIKGLAKTSKTPGRTQLMNCFSLSNNRRLIDLPGYGFAKVPEKVKQRWHDFINDYLSRRRCLTGLVLLSDSRHPLKPSDQAMLDWANTYAIPVLVLLTKSDKLTRSALAKTRQQVDHLLQNDERTQVIMFSSLNKMGLQDAREALSNWFDNEG